MWIHWGRWGTGLRTAHPDLLLTPQRMSKEDKVRSGISQTGSWGKGGCQPDGTTAEEDNPLKSLVVEEVVKGPETAILPKGV